MPVTLTWLGHAAFLVEGEGKRIVLDPYKAGAAGTYAPIDLAADIVAVSHENERYHSCLEAVRGEPAVVRGLEIPPGEEVVAAGVAFGAVRVADNDGEPIAMLRFRLGGVSFCHMGDLGHAPTDEQAEAVRGVDVLLALAGGPPTIALPDLVQAIRRIGPRLVVPMHFGNEKINLKLAPVDDLLALLPPEMPRERRDSPSLSLSPEALPPEGETRLVVLPPAR